MTGLKNWQFSKETAVTDLSDVLTGMFITDEEVSRHEEDACFLFMPHEKGVLYEDKAKRGELLKSMLKIIRDSENVVYLLTITYRETADRSAKTLAEEQKKLIDLLDLLNSEVIPILQEMHREQENEAKGTEIESMVIAIHFKERYTLPHVHFLYLAPKPELSILIRGFLRHLPPDDSSQQLDFAVKGE